MGIIHWIDTAINTYLAHPLRGDGYLWWSGPGANFGELSILTAILAHLRHKNCHHKGCWRMGQVHPKYHWPACKVHWDEQPEHLQI